MITCYNCSANLNSHVVVEGEATPPGEGDITVCAHCGHLSIFVDDNEARQPTKEELDELREDPALWDLIEHAKRLVELLTKSTHGK